MLNRWWAAPLLLAVLAACSPSGPPAPEGKPGASPEASGAGPGVIDPPAVRNAWKGAVLELKDKRTGETREIALDMGAASTQGGLELTLQAVQPDFALDAGTAGTRSNEPNNAAARVIVRENGREVFDGWLSRDFPDIHPFAHERYGILLKNLVKK